MTPTLKSIKYLRKPRSSFMRAVLSKYDPKHDTSVRYTISNQLAMWRLLFKSKYFEHEKEVRVIISVAKGTSIKNHLWSSNIEQTECTLFHT